MTILSAEELNDACLHAAATIVVAFVCGGRLLTCRLNDDSREWPSPISRIEIACGDDWDTDDELAARPAIHEAGAMAVAKSHGRRPHLLHIGGEEPNETAEVLNGPKVWKAVETLAQLIKDGHIGEGEGDDFSSAATALLKSIDLPVMDMAAE
jgi:hypothetical protein